MCCFIVLFRFGVFSQRDGLPRQQQTDSRFAFYAEEGTNDNEVEVLPPGTMPATTTLAAPAVRKIAPPGMTLEEPRTITVAPPPGIGDDVVKQAA